MSKREDDWAERKIFRCKLGYELLQYTKIDGGNVTYSGSIMITAMRNGQQVNFPFEFDFPPNSTRKWCMDNFEDEAKSAVMDWEKEKKAEAEKQAKQAKQKIIMPSKGQILGPNSRPIKGM